MKELFTAKDYAIRMSESIASWFNKDQLQWHYEHGLVLQSIYAVGKEFNLTQLCSWVNEMYDSKINKDGSIISYRIDEFNLDQINPGKQLFNLLEDYGEAKYKVALDLLRNQLEHHPRTNSGGFWHKQIYPFQMWLDGLYMQGPFYARYVLNFENEEKFDDIVHQFELIYTNARDPHTGLLYHAWDESKKQLWANPKTGCSPHFWGRALGWYCIALVDALDWIPDVPSQKKNRDTLISIIESLIDPILDVQDTTSGLWYQVLNMPNREKNYLETSASAMFVWFLIKTIRKSYLDPTSKKAFTVLDCAKQGYEGLLTKLTTDESNVLHLHDICSVAGLGGNPYRDGSYEYYVKEPVATNDFKGVGPFIYASLEAARMNLC